MLNRDLAQPIYRPQRARWLKRWRFSDWATVAVFALPFLLYLRTLAPTIYNLDSAELTTAVATNGLIRATGYPLYLFLGKLWSWLPVGDMGFRLNLFSAFCGATTIFLLDRFLRYFKVDPWARLGALGLLATAPYFWAMSLVAEVYTLHTAMTAGVLLLLIRWRERPSPARLAWPVFLTVLSLGNHAATILLIPAWLFFVLTTSPPYRWPARAWLMVAGAALAGGAIFLLLPLRYAASPVFNYAGQFDAQGTFIPVDLLTLEGLWWLVSGKVFAGQMFGYSRHELLPQVQEFGLQLWIAFLAIGIGPGLLGMAALLRRDWRAGGMLLLVFLANAVFYINYRVVDKATMYLPAFLPWAIWAAVGYQVLIGWLSDLTGGETGKRIGRAIIVGAVLMALLINWSRVDLSDDWSTRRQSEAILRQVQPNALVFGWWETAPGLQYLQLVEKQRSDVLVINRFLISADDMNQLILDQLGQRPIYINNPSIELLKTAKVTPAGDLYLLETSFAPPSYPTTISFD